MKLLSTLEAAAALGVTVARVQQMIWAGRLPAQKVGRDYVIDEDDLKLVKDRKTGRPPKAKPSTNNHDASPRTRGSSAATKRERERKKTKV
jgi:excisionase family DNA binding protein